ncbi:MAG: phosphoglucosamine mutase [Bacillota bacterium]|nr:phosphoglucosamine mutase [Bacillota bacterium]
MGKLFGTDGVRGLANRELTPMLAFKLGRAVGVKLINNSVQSKPKVVIGKDTRISCGMLEAALTAGFCSVGVDVVSLGVIPTPGVAYLTRVNDFAGGVVISASHNPASDNGIKFFGSNGYKLPDQVENEIEAVLFADDNSFPQPIGAEVGSVSYWPEGKSNYAHYLKTSIDNDFSGLKIVLDCANGATSQLAPQLFKELGAEVILVAAEPNGVNINLDCGSTHLDLLSQQVVDHGAHLGLAFDGDGDRVLAVDHLGSLIDGDQILLMLANYFKENERLKNNILVVTVMSNLGLHQAAKKLTIDILETKVGDRYVLEEMQKSDAIIGGEQSGHIILLNYNTTGDGMLTGLQLISLLVAKGSSLKEEAAIMERLPQVLVNVPVKDKRNLNNNDEINRVIDEVSTVLKDRGRLLVRPSGTEPLVRVMAEGPNEQELQQLVGKVAEAIKTSI